MKITRIEVEGFGEPDCHWVGDNRDRAAGLVGPAVEGQQCCFRDAGQRPGVHFVVGPMTHQANVTD